MSNGESESAGAIAPPPLIHAAGLLVGYLLNRWYPLPLPATRTIDFMGGLLLGFGIALGIAAASELKAASTTLLPYRPTTSIVETGPFAHSRNPIYVANTLIYLGLTLIIGTIWPLVLLPVVLLVIDRGVIAREERYLERKFGEEYRSYLTRVRRWI